MKNTELIIENGIVAGNAYDKYGTRNPIARYIMKGFHNALDELTLFTGASEIHEVGCGEGTLCISWAKQHKIVRGSDFSRQIIELARTRAKRHQVNVEFKAAGIDKLRPEDDKAQLIVCCEVLEHLENPKKALSILATLADPYLIVSVPREPLWRMLNIARGKYISRFGNTPGHIQHWSKKSFLSLLPLHFDIIKVRTPIPWTMALCRLKIS
jgi:2-polyprenyl-3-methyl-5-hydroxy-6-metoxy-1,4-benzoquinol methylase